MLVESSRNPFSLHCGVSCMNSCSARGVKKFATVGTKSLSFDRSGFPSFWCSTAVSINITFQSQEHIRLVLDDQRGLLWSLIISSTSRMISAYRRWATLACWWTVFDFSSNTAVGCECRTNGTARRPCCGQYTVYEVVGDNE